uniref:Replication protein A 70 kDa DNA-binding subunit B/D first OB fold domain-containing protein n=1 Tax=Brassica oleracea var. oleracea TaxID=109376 RepID=A0A0D3C020_BRAOL
SSNQRPNVCRSTFESLRLGRSSQSIASGFLRLWDSLNFKKDKEFVGITIFFLDEKVNSVIHGFIPAGRANHYMSSLKAGFIVKIDRFEVVRCSSMYKITDHSFLICFISLTIIDEVITGALETNLQSIRLFDNLQVIASTNLELSDEVGQICYVQGSDFSKETTRVVIHLLIDP